MNKSKVKYLTAFIDETPDSFQSYYQRGVLYGGKYIESDECCGSNDVENVHEAIKDFEKVIELSPDFANAYFHKACLYFALDIDDEEACELIEHALGIEPNNVDFLIKHSEIITYHGENAHIAIEIMDKVISIQPSLLAFYLKGLHLMSDAEYDVFVGNVDNGYLSYEKAIEMFNMVIAMDGSSEYKQKASEFIDECLEHLRAKNDVAKN
ncbi:hypothetical protein C9J12_05075 [Photobacterium frigidiphilum]|uniref:Uncharacterized protein n=1 Tax=Photobacterium frigidiphilum TaxID=264736 RepID=A0A2T3JM94_9GAMM|nr:hypothetical protein [Photobacterium frigidiphilum]PSU50118.1 hypothetical protein C9J12_05075 [Photobacterium frigidiphilum]